MPIEPGVASLRLRGVTSDGTEIPIVLEIGRPYRDEEGSCWHCPVRLSGLYGDRKLAAQAGEDSLQSLVLAIALGRQLIEAFVETGGRLYHWDDPDSPFDFEGYPVGR